jgi:N-acyl homoserine lactone hydrolase
VPTAAEPLPAALPLPGGVEGASVKLRPLLTAVAKGPPAWIHRVEGRMASLKAFGIGVPRDQWLEIPVVAFHVEHPGAGHILIDTGFHSSVAVDPKKNLGRVGARAFPGIDMQQSQSVAAQLRAIGVEASQVRVVVMTHLHIDHASAMSDFPAATFLFSDREWEAATTGPRRWAHGYRQKQFDHAFDYRLLDFEAPVADSFATFGRSFDLLGDGSVRLVFTPGHTLGHMSVVLRLRGREVLIAGDAIYTMRALRESALPFRSEDEHLFRRSLKEIQRYAEHTPSALIVPGHDMDAWRELNEVYE